jgi:flagellar biosynthesis protein FlhG
MNKVMDERDVLTGRSIADVVKKYLLIDLRFLGAIPYDERVHWSLKKRTPFIALHPDSDVASSLRAVALSLVDEIGKGRALPSGPALVT